MGLSAISTKSAVVSTFGADALAASAQQVRDTYDWQASTYVEQPAISTWQAAFLEAIHARRTPKASLVAPFGYGKSATAIGVWHACEAANILAVPPLACGSFAEIAYAVCDWLAYRLPDKSEEITGMRERFLIGSADLLARRDEREFAIPYDQALAAIQDKLERGYLDFEDVSINLLALLESATSLVEGSGYSGLVVIVDEGQQLIGNAGKGVLVALRQLVWGLRTREMPFGLLLTLDPDTERTLADRAGDILHRVKEDGLYLDIRDVYGRDFPARLWQQYSIAFELSDDDSAAIDRPTLDALGQLCEREDLSNGPRTVVDVLQHAATRRAAGAPPGYSPLQMIDDFVSGTIRFVGDRNTLPALASELLSYGYFQRAPDRAAALKLVAAFPRGCPPAVAKHYSLDGALTQLDTDLRGEVLTELDEGLALIELQRVGRPANRLNQLLRRYWMQITDEELFAEDAPKTFAETLVPLLFPTKQHDLNGWNAIEPVRLAADGTYRAIYEGTGSLDYPLRRIGVCVLPAATNEPARPTDLDFWLIFRVSTERASSAHLSVDAPTGTAIWELPLVDVAPAGLDAGLRWIEHYLNPHPISAATVLSLLRYLDRESAPTADARDSARIEDTIDRLRRWLLARVFNEEVFARAGHPVAQSGAGALAEFLYSISRARWPRYRALATQRHWSSMLEDYIHALSQIPVPIRSGAAVFAATKSEVASLFGQERHAGFDSRARQYGALLELVGWKRDEAELRFVPLPAELEIAREVRRRGTLNSHDAYRGLRADGFSAAESSQILRLGVARALFLADDHDLLPPDVPHAAEIASRCQGLLDRLHALAPALAAEREEVVTIQGADTHTSDPTWRLDRIECRVEAAEVERQRQQAERLHKERSLLLDAAGHLRSLPTPPAAGGLRAHLAAAHVRLDQQRCVLVEAVQRVADLADADPIRRLREDVMSYSRSADAYRRWVDLGLNVETLRGTSNNGGSALDAENLLSRAREILSVDGLVALDQVALLELHLAKLEAKDSERSSRIEASTRLAAERLTSELSALFDSPNFEPLAHAGSLESIQVEAAKRVRRGVSALRVRAAISDLDARTRARFVARLDRIGESARCNGSGLFTVEGDRLARSVVEDIRRAREALKGRGASHAITELSRSLAAGPVDLVPALDHGEEPAVDEWLRDVMRLARAGLVRIVMDVPEQDQQTAEGVRQDTASASTLAAVE